MRFTKKKVAIGAAVSASLLVAGAAVAGVPANVSVNGSTLSANHTITLSAASLGLSVGSASFGCTSVSGTSAANFVTAGTKTATSVDPIFTLGLLAFTGCTGLGGSYNTTQPCRWTFEALSGVTASDNDLIDGKISNLCLNVALSPLASLCSFRVDGYAHAIFNESTGEIIINEFSGGITVTTVTGCGGAMAPGDEVDLSVTLQVGGALSFPGSINVFP